MPDQPNPLTHKLGNFAPLSESDRQLLDEWTRNAQSFEAHCDIVSEGELPGPVFVLLEGFACRYRILEDGSRQILTFLLPGDICDLHVFLLRAMDHSIATLLPSRLSLVDTDEVMEVLFRRPRVSAAFWWSMLQEESILRERIVAVGRRNGAGKVAYILCELLWRLRALGLAGSGAFRLPLTQAELADTLGMTPAYVNRILQQFRKQKLIATERTTMRILDEKQLTHLAGFNPDYLHMGGAPEQMKAQFDAMEKRMQRRR